MIFTLEALQAEFGDSLLLHYGSKESPKYILIDGGPAGVYQAALRKRLEQLRAKEASKQLALQMAMASHYDRDHITGIISLTNELIEKKEAGEPLPYKIIRLWHNSLDDFISASVKAQSAACGNSVDPTSLTDDLPLSLSLNASSLAVAADVKQGRTLRDNARKLSIRANAPFKSLVAAPPKGRKEIDMGSGLKLTIIGPNQRRIDALQKEWDSTLERLRLAKGAGAAEAIAADFLDQSVPNLSSIVALAEAGGKTMLLTGDARGDDILSGLSAAGMLKDGRARVDLLKLPHHGSDRNVSTDFFRQIAADNYVISANGKNGNPDLGTLEMISEARGQSEFMIHLTNKEPRLEKFFAEEKKRGKKYKAIFRKPAALSIEIKLGD
jgi:hypothetical protein